MVGGGGGGVQTYRLLLLLDCIYNFLFFDNQFSINYGISLLRLKLVRFNFLGFK